jgi:ABC-2 type transport system permease protein
MQRKLDAQSAVGTKIVIYLQQMFALVEADVRKLRHDPSELFTRMVQPVIWLLIFGQAMTHVKAIPSGNVSYLDYMAPGILSQSILLISIFYGISFIWERDKGVLYKLLVTPTPRLVLVFGRAMAAGVRALSQVVIVYLISFFVGIHLRFDPLALLGVLLMALIGGGVFSCLSLIVASIVKKRERFMGVGQAITMPLFFASNALYPIEIMPGWLQIFSLFNPLTYQVDALRHLMIVGEPCHFSLPVDFGVELIVLGILALIASYTCPKILY